MLPLVAHSPCSGDYEPDALLPISIVTCHKLSNQTLERQVVKWWECLDFFGGWVMGRCLALNRGRSIFAAGVGIHPSFKPDIFAAGSSGPMELAVATQNKPILWLPAKEDDDLKPTSPLVKAMAKRRAMTPDQISIPFDFPHGFVARGRFMGQEYREAQEKVIRLTVDFFDQHLQV